MRLTLILPLVLMTSTITLPALANTCSIDINAVNTRIDQMGAFYDMVVSDITCDTTAPNTIPARQMICDSATSGDMVLFQMERLDTMAWVSIAESATGEEMDPENPLLDGPFITARDYCKDEACLCETLIQHTNDSLGGTSPYLQ
ncbi:MAG: hypothetical protein WAT09_18800 [Paracoccaceae bacterium]